LAFRLGSHYFCPSTNFWVSRVGSSFQIFPKSGVLGAGGPTIFFLPFFPPGVPQHLIYPFALLTVFYFGVGNTFPIGGAHEGVCTFPKIYLSPPFVEGGPSYESFYSHQGGDILLRKRRRRISGEHHINPRKKGPASTREKDYPPRGAPQKQSL